MTHTDVFKSLSWRCKISIVVYTSTVITSYEHMLTVTHMFGKKNKAVCWHTLFCPFELVVCGNGFMVLHSQVDVQLVDLRQVHHFIPNIL